MNSRIIKIVFSSLLLSLCFLFLNSARALASQNLVVNEIAWMGTEVSYNDEWIELYNNTNQNINLDGWTLEAKDGIPTISLVGTVPANGFFILERTDDSTLPDILADQIYKGSLGNDGENLELYDNFGNLIDSVDCSAGWFAGNNTTKQTMERKSGVRPGSDPQNWQTSQNPGGTPKAKNSDQKIVNSKLLISAENSSLPSQLKEVITTFPSNVFINEILPSPEGSDSEEEWIEIFNKNEFEIDLSDWKIQDTAGKTNTYTFPKNTKISVNGFFVLKRPTSKIILNNDGDGLKLINPANEIVDEISYPKAEKGKSYNKADSDWVWSGSLTPGSENAIPVQNLEVEKEKSSEFTKGKGLAAIGEEIPKESLFPLFIAGGLAIFSGIIILFLKRNLTRSSKEVK